MRILHRYILHELLQVFLLAFVGLSALFVIAGIMQEAMHKGISPTQLLNLLPLVIPGTLPYTVPATLLLAVTVVYGRLAADNEITATKAAGINVLWLVMPAVVLGLALSLFLTVAHFYFIPVANARLRSAVLNNIENMIYAVLKHQGQLKVRDVPYEIYVRSVEGRTLRGVTLKQRGKGRGYKRVVVAEAARLHFDPEHKLLHVDLHNTQVYDERVDIIRRGQERVSVPLPQLDSSKAGPRDMTPSQIARRVDQLRDSIRDTVGRQALEVTRHLMTGQTRLLPRLPWIGLLQDRAYDQRMIMRLQCELPFRSAIAFGCLFFVLLGCPVAILFQRGDYLSAFLTCFLPIIGLYYPLLILSLNLGKEGIGHPMFLLWSGNTLLLILSLLAFRPVLRH